MEFKIENTAVYGLNKSFIASGNAMRTTMQDNELEANEDRRVVYNDSMKNGYRVEVASYYNKSLVTYSFIKIEINDSEDNSL